MSRAPLVGRPWHPRRAGVPWGALVLLLALVLAAWLALVAFVPLDGWRAVAM